MALLNYSTTIAADKSIAEISQILANAGANRILTEYEQGTGQIVALSFEMQLGDQQIAFRLPTDWRPVEKVLNQQNVRNRAGGTREDQARRVAWRITKDWVEAQMAIIETRMVTTAQVFLPYAVHQDGRSHFEHIASNPGLLLGDGR